MADWGSLKVESPLTPLVKGFFGGGEFFDRMHELRQQRQEREKAKAKERMDIETPALFDPHTRSKETPEQTQARKEAFYRDFEMVYGKNTPKPLVPENFDDEINHAYAGDTLQAAKGAPIAALWREKVATFGLEALNGHALREQGKKAIAEMQGAFPTGQPPPTPVTGTAVTTTTPGTPPTPPVPPQAMDGEAFHATILGPYYVPPIPPEAIVTKKWNEIGSLLAGVSSEIAKTGAPADAVLSSRKDSFYQPYVELKNAGGTQEDFDSWYGRVTNYLTAAKVPEPPTQAQTWTHENQVADNASRDMMNVQKQLEGAAKRLRNADQYLRDTRPLREAHWALANRAAHPGMDDAQFAEFMKSQPLPFAYMDYNSVTAYERGRLSDYDADRATREAIAEAGRTSRAAIAAMQESGKMQRHEETLAAKGGGATGVANPEWGDKDYRTDAKGRVYHADQCVDFARNFLADNGRAVKGNLTDLPRVSADQVQPFDILRLRPVGGYTVPHYVVVNPDGVTVSELQSYKQTTQTGKLGKYSKKKTTSHLKGITRTRQVSSLRERILSVYRPKTSAGKAKVAVKPQVANVHGPGPPESWHDIIDNDQWVLLNKELRAAKKAGKQPGDVAPRVRAIVVKQMVPGPSVEEAVNSIMHKFYYQDVK